MVDPTTLATQVPWGSLIKATATAVELVRRQDWLAEAWRVLMLRLGSEHDIVILGAKGVGKTTLLDNLRGASAQASYALPPTSIRPEAAVTTLDGARAITVIPGDHHRTREDALRAAIITNPRLRVVVFVVCDGLATLRDEAVRQSAVRSGLTLADVRKQNRAEELRELQSLVEQLRIARNQTHLRLVIAVNKADLWWPDLETVYQRYDKSGVDPFAETLRELEGRMGSQNIHICTVPAVAWSEDYVLGDENVPVALRNEQDRRLLTRRFVETLS